LMKIGSPPTARKARTGELTPPGMTLEARAKSSLETGSDMRRSVPILRVAVKPDSLKPRHRRTARAALAAYTRALGGFYRKRAKGSHHPDGRTHSNSDRHPAKHLRSRPAPTQRVRLLATETAKNAPNRAGTRNATTNSNPVSISSRQVNFARLKERVCFAGPLNLHQEQRQ